MPSVERVDGLNPQVLEFPEHNTPGSFAIGDLVKVATNGKVQIATADAITGIARTGYTGTENSGIRVELIDSQGLYSARYKASATAQSLVGDCLDFTFTVGAHTLNETSATTDVYCVGLDPRDTVGDTSGRLLIRFYSSLLDATGT